MKRKTCQIVEELHEEAMNLVDLAVAAQREGKPSLAIFRHALTLEIEAAGLVTIEPSRSILYRSAAALALEAGKAQEAERLATLGLDGDPPPEIAAELREFIGAAKEEKS